MRKPMLALAAGAAVLTVAAGLAIAFPFATLFIRLGLESFRPQVIGWEAKNAWQKCESAIGGTTAWPATAASACAAMHMCANEANLTSDQRKSLASAARRLTGCEEP